MNIIAEAEQGHQQQRAEELSEYRALLLKEETSADDTAADTAADAVRLRELAERLGRTDRLREDQYIARKVAQADAVDDDGLSSEMAEATQRVNAAADKANRARRAMEKAEAELSEAQIASDRISNRQARARERQREAGRLRASYADLFA